MKDISELIASVPLFASLRPREIELLALNLRPHDIPARALIFREGACDDHFFIIVEGRVEIFKALGEEGERFLAERGTGSFLGEMSLFTADGHHTASVRASTPLKVLEMTRSEFDALLHLHPDLAYELLRMFSKRLDESENITIQDLIEKNRQLSLAYEQLQEAHLQIVEKEKLEKELAIARDIQGSMLLHEMPRVHGFDFGALMVPARAVGGDFYDLFPLGHNKIGIVVGDVSDKGVPAALFMALTFSLLRAEASRGAAVLDTILSVNHLLLDLNTTDMFVTVLFGIIDSSTCSFEYVRAGHPLPVILDSEGRPLRLESGLGQSIGLFEEPIIDQNRIVLQSGSVMLLFSDGLSEAIDNNGQMIADNLPEILSSIRDQSAPEICSSLWELVEKFGTSEDQQDDFTLLCVKCN
jgi:phosphoserine phosphatase RsbU/P